MRASLIFLIPCSLILATPAALAMVASVDGTTMHNTTADASIAEIWNRTVWPNAGTGTYLGKDAGGTRWVLTANHVSAGDGSIVTDDEQTITLSYSGMHYSMTNTDGSTADLKLISVTAESAEQAAYLNALENIDIYTGSLPTTSPLYCVGTGVSLTYGEGISSGTRTKQWAEFSLVDSSTAFLPSSPYNYHSDAYSAYFSNQYDSFQAGMYDSGSGIFIKKENENDWQVAGVAITVGGTQNGVNVGYIEEISDRKEVVCATNFVNLAAYADQISAIMAIPEPSAFSLWAGLLGLVLTTAGRRRSRNHKN